MPHDWPVVGPVVERPAESLASGRCRFLIDAHRSRHGPYAAAGTLLVRFVECFGEAARQAAANRLVTLLAVTPDLGRMLPVPPEVARSLAFSREGNHPDWSLRSAHAIIDFLLDCLARADASAQVTFVNTEHADPLDLEWLTVLLRRADPDRLSIVIEASAEAGWAEADDFEEDAPALAAAARRCMHFAYYPPALEWAERASRLAEERGDEITRNGALRDMIFALLLLGRHDEAEALCERCLADIADAALQAHATYAQAIMRARLRPKPQHDYPAARRCLEQSQAFTASLPQSGARSANLAFLRNTLALVEMREGDAAAALRLMDEAIDALRREAPDRFASDAMILFKNRARLHLAAGREADALANLASLLALEPSNAEALFDRALIHQRAGRRSEAIADYDAALFWAPPQAETLFNRAGLLAEVGQTEAALRDFDHLLDIDPDHVEGLIGRARLNWQLASLTSAAQDVAHGLMLRPDDARLHCLNGLVALARRALDEAERAFDQAIECDSALADGWANRATVHWKRGALGHALTDLDHALALRDDPAIRRNRDKVAAAIDQATVTSSCPATSRSQGIRLAGLAGG